MQRNNVDNSVGAATVTYNDSVCSNSSTGPEICLAQCLSCRAMPSILNKCSRSGSLPMHPCRMYLQRHIPKLRARLVARTMFQLGNHHGQSWMMCRYSTCTAWYVGMKAAMWSNTNTTFVNGLEPLDRMGRNGRVCAFEVRSSLMHMHFLARKVEHILSSFVLRIYSSHVWNSNTTSRAQRSAISTKTSPTFFIRRHPQTTSCNRANNAVTSQLPSIT